ncbi:hypothetical protein THF5H11_70152 [Vibrio jasicida]|uniref:Uncharacterized protein n=1 Tax=Vibrio jasicida TaxID=766224 RepID=A0AAU9QFA2_9VIBR|nr:hypothetical protein THF5H11_70152 [Vibrio jasicida]CAH1561471.1 hypothetical protein THF1C08_120025 [Vibrio jasicida]CAH1571714.1 hypothetical protein THF1A12_110141 [Vibrio jasicida]
MLCLQTRISSSVEFYHDVLSTLPVTKHILPVFILTCLSNFLHRLIRRCFFI